MSGILRLTTTATTILALTLSGMTVGGGALAAVNPPPARFGLGGPAVATSSVDRSNWTVGNITLGAPGGYPTDSIFVPLADQMFTTVYPSYVVATSVSTGLVLARTYLDQPVSELAYDGVTQEVLATGPGIREVFVLDAATDQLVRTVPLPNPAQALCFDPTNGEVLLLTTQVVHTGGGVIFAEGTLLVLDGTNRSYPLLATLAGAGGGLVGIFFASMTLDTTQQAIYITGWAGLSGFTETLWFSLSNASVIGTLGALGGGDSTFNPVDDQIYLAGGGGGGLLPSAPNRISVVSGATHQPERSITVSGAAGISSLVFDPTTQHLYAIDPTGALYTIRTPNGTVVARTSLTATCAAGASIAEPSGSVVIADACGNELEIVSPSENRSGQMVVGGDAPQGLAYDSRTGDLVVADSYSGSATVLSTTRHQVVARIPGIPDAQSAVYSPSTSEVYVLGGDGAVAVLNDTTWAVADAFTLALPKDWQGYGWVATAFDSANAQVDVLREDPYSGNSKLYVISAASRDIVGEFNLSGSSVFGGDALAYDPVHGTIWIGAIGEYTGWFAWPNLTLTAASQAIPRGDNVQALAFCEGEDTLYAGVADSSWRDVGYVVGINVTSGSIASLARVGGIPHALACSAHAIISADFVDSNISFVNESTHRTFASMALGLGPAALAYDSATGAMYVANMWSNNVSVLLPEGPAHPATLLSGLPAYAVFGAPLLALLAGGLVAALSTGRPRPQEPA